MAGTHKLSSNELAELVGGLMEILQANLDLCLVSQISVFFCCLIDNCYNFNDNLWINFMH